MPGRKIKIWGRKNSANVQKVLWCCAELEIPFERVDLAGAFGGNDEPEYLAKNPHGRVPTIEDGEVIVWESNSCIRYLASTRHGVALYPADAARRSEIERWMDWQLATLNDPIGALLFGFYRAAPERRDDSALASARVEAMLLWSTVDGWLATRDFLAGRNFSLADIAVGVMAYRWFAFPIERPEMKYLEAWHERLTAREGFRAHVALPLS
jgi:glutathione S-transferase